MQQMTPTSVDSSHRVTRAVSVLAAGYAILGGAVALVGWVFDVPRLTDWPGDGISMFANAAICMVMSGAALLFLVSRRAQASQKTAVRLLAAIVGIVAALTVFE